ncbi:MAG: acetyl-CoA decarbonylase/synthase complex subunit alpha/beta [Armatimonadota bacterium]|nr:acetyl-CoA decarbonylase/synthase complex subunit alpha/beta [Armatimonadota bacterium]MDR7519503.1 acetyl-CoA decarbonylase/synthase complex subunit alpha/beta [Armatimonadota bacterium]MDR7550205.1 acetyl-CoA decarbonylase/synthase complex subunit alpha/beta [Armatimonadota bacterium]
MSRIIATAAIRGAQKYVAEAEAALTRAMDARGGAAKLEFPNTAFYLPLIYALTGIKVKTMQDAWEPLRIARSLLPPVPTDRLWLPYLGDALDAGISTLIAEEIIEAVRYATDGPPGGIWLGFTDDAILRTQGIKLVDGRMPGFAACVGAMPTVDAAVRLARGLQERNILVFLSSHTNGASMAEQLADAGVEMNWDTYLVPYGKDTSATVHALNFAARAAMTFGGLVPGDLARAREILLYNKARVYAFVLALGEVDDEKYATAAGAINFGFPVIADTDIPQILPTGICTYEHVVSRVPHDQLVAKAIEVRGLRLKITKIPIPVSYSAAFEGERVRKEQLHVEFGRQLAPAFEYLRGRDMHEVEDGKIEVIGPDLDTAEVGGHMPLGLLIEVAGRKLQKDFEPILERQVHRFLNGAMGVMHIGQRDIPWIRISREAVAAGFRLRHFGDILHAKYHEEYPALVDKVQVTIYTEASRILEILEEARRVWDERDARVAGMTDETVDVYYSCTLCQSYAPNHVCIITPERLGLCGAYNWLDGKASYEINPAGPNQPVEKGACLDATLGMYEGINGFVYAKSNKTVEQVSLYSMIQFPMTSCGCFECIMALVPEANGVMVVNREYTGMTPVGMTFSTLAGMVGGGIQTPGFLGVGRLYLTSRKFISADGGLPRLVWMPRELKDALADRLRARARDLGDETLVDKIADETVAITAEELVAFLERVGHPALRMPALI